ncbi:RNA polymerase sigma factor [Siphonobacter aquaeclarae]|uniref:RNA polymerase sigma-70 factor, ECF subfamily n=1 Tax=Siphonobacter aquaeclarae TaxID=563176 RepID=A0A1G9M7H1_9BACT|nr:RNA polymerase sigma factor [Siphonobacter aquaeclarae]MBO9640353.1 RNA polymerase sigma factor [Siphonobacter aquaeclarae]SDL69891.1 RNA polymerase sigma-70 factor, ECF subfamily [Siphonobacter aquaeclarae]
MFFRKKASFSDDDLEGVIQACLSDDKRAQRVLFQQYFSYAKSICLRYSSSTEEAEEILNEGFLKVFRNLERYDSQLPFKAWLRTIMVNSAISYFRKNQKFHSEIGYDAVPDPVLDEGIVDQISADEILQLVQQLKPIYRSIFLMHVVDGYQLREIADLFNIKEGTVRSHFARARALLQQMVIESYPYVSQRNWGNTPF